MNFKEKKLLKLMRVINNCSSCKLHLTRNKVVVGEGNFDAKIMFIGEAPGKEENIQGKPFVGRAGQFLTDLITQEFKMTREDIYITNICKCRPTINLEGVKDRTPEPDEIGNCFPYLTQQINIIDPKIIITLGNPATQSVLETSLGITKLHGKWFEYVPLGRHPEDFIHVMPMYHPSYIIRNGGHSSLLKNEIINDIRSVLEMLEYL